MTPRHQIIAVAAALSLVGAVDFLQRIYVPRSSAARTTDTGTPALPDPPLSLASAQERLQSWLATPAVTAAESAPTDAVVKPGETDVRTPDRADIGGWRFVLRGVFDAGPPFAVFDVMSSANGEIEQYRLSAGEAIKGVRVEQISGRRVRLSDGEQVIHLALFVDPKDDVVPINNKDE